MPDQCLQSLIPPLRQRLQMAPMSLADVGVCQRVSAPFSKENQEKEACPSLAWATVRRSLCPLALVSALVTMGI